MSFLTRKIRVGIRVIVDTDGNALAINNVYKAQCDGFFSGLHTSNTNSGYTDLYVDNSNPPTTRVDNDSAGSGGAYYKQGCQCLVKKGEYIKYTDSLPAGNIANWTPFGTGGLVKQ